MRFLAAQKIVFAGPTQRQSTPVLNCATIMYEDLEAIASLRIGDAVKQVSGERSQQLSAALRDLTSRGLGHPHGGQMVSARLNSTCDANEGVCRAVYEVWLELILKRNNGRLSRADADFIRDRVKSVAEGQTRNAGADIGGPNAGSLKDWATKQVEARGSLIVGDINRQLEIKVREQAAFPAPDTSFRSFLHAFTDNWTTKMSGPLTVPFTILALFLSGYARWIFAALAITAAIYTSYGLWKGAHTHRTGS